MSVVLYRKYRSERFSDLIGQDAVTSTLANAVAKDMVGHAYIFSGPRGTGKTSAARILARAINCTDSKKGEPCNKCDNCKTISSGTAVDIIEIDAASHTGVEDIREVIEKVEFAPARFRKKVYIVDEVHMLSKSAFNALLKTLEEPPAHVVFILATTEIHKVPVTILSRCQRFDFRLGRLDEITMNLKRIVEREGVVIDDDALEFIASSGNGSYRDSVTILEKVLSNSSIIKDGRIMKTEVMGILGIPEFSLLESFVVALSEMDSQAAMSILEGMVEGGGDVKQFHKSLLEYLRSMLVTQLKGDRMAIDISMNCLFKIIKVIGSALRDESTNIVPTLALELAVVELCGMLSLEEGKRPQLNFDKSKTADKKKDVIKSEVRQTPSAKSLDRVTLSDIKSKWPEVIDKVKPHNGHLFAFLGKSRIDSIKNGLLKVTVPFEFYKDRIEDSKGRDVISSCLENVFGEKMVVNCEVGKVSKKELAIGEDDEKLIEDALDVFSEDVV